MNYEAELRKILTKDIDSWMKFHRKLLDIPRDENQSIAGRVFEVFVKYYFLLSDVCSEVYLYDEIPLRLKKKLRLPATDHGVDLLLVEGKSKYIAVQSKFRKNQNESISWSKDKLANLIAHGQVDQHFIFSNASSVDKTTIDQGKDLQKFLVNDLLELSKDDFQSIYKRIKSGKASPRKYFKPLPHQKKAISKVDEGFNKLKHSRGQLILPCGAGKTLAALWITEKLNPSKTLVLVPSLALLRQFKNAWMKQRKQKFNYFCICSEKDIDDSNKDLSIGNTSELGTTGLGVTTDSKKILKYLSVPGNTVVFSTYQSSPEIARALSGKNIRFDLAICDEAHKTAGSKNSSFTTIHDDNKIPVDKRLYMTATPKIVSKKIRTKLGEETDEYLADMNNEAIFGPTFHRMSFKEAINDGILVDYKILAIGVKDEDLRKKIINREYLEDGNFEEVANNYALKRAMDIHEISHSITFHSSVLAAKNFSKRHVDIDADCSSYHVNGKISTADRELILEQFVEDERSLVSNARCLTEGIDVPSIDLVYFCDPKNSKVDIVQACGRALRLDKERGKKIGYIALPIFHNDVDSLEDDLKNGVYKNLIQVIRAMSDHDDRLEDEITKILWNKGKRKPSQRRITIDLSVTEKGFIQFLNLSKEQISKIFTQVVRKNVVSQWRPYEDALVYSRSLELSSESMWREFAKSVNQSSEAIPEDVPRYPDRAYKDKGWNGWHDWLGKEKVEYLPFNDARAFARSLKLKNTRDWIKYSERDLVHKISPIQGLPIYADKTYEDEGWIDWFDFLGTATKDDKWFQNLELLGEYFKKNKTWPEITDCLGEFKVGRWAARQRSSNRKNKLDRERIEALINIDFIWDPLDQLWIDNIKKLNSFILINKRLPSAISDDLVEKHVGIWCSSLRNRFRDDLLSDTQLDELHRAGFKLGEVNDTWIIGCQVLIDFRQINSDRWPKLREKTRAGYAIGNWCSNQRMAFKNKKLSQDNMQLLNDMEFPWDLREHLKSERFYSFDQAKSAIKKFNLRTRTEFSTYTNSENFDENIPRDPRTVYLKYGWNGWGDFLGTGKIAPQDRVYLGIVDAKKFVHLLKIDRQRDWASYCRGEMNHLPNLPDNIPRDPRTVYQADFKGWGDWLGTGRVAHQDKEWMEFDEARDFVRNLNFNTMNEYNDYCKGNRSDLPPKPVDLPAGPSRVYKGIGWKGNGDWLGTGRIADWKKVYKSYDEAKKITRLLDLETYSDWKKYIKGEFPNKPALPDDIPKSPDRHYKKKKEWLGWKDWFGVE